MNKLYKLRHWLTPSEAAAHIRDTVEEGVELSDVYRLALDGHLTLSVNFVNHAKARKGKIVPLAEARTFTTISPFETGPSNEITITSGILISENEVLDLETEVITLDGIFDLPMIGGERLNIEAAYQLSSLGPDVTLTNIDGTFVKGTDGTLYQLQDHFGKREIPYGHPDNYYPAADLPRDSVLVVRMEALREFEQSLAPLETGNEKSVSTKERTTMLAIIGLLAKEASVDLSKPSKAAQIIVQRAEKEGLSLGQRTIEEYLKKVPDAIERKGK